MSKSKILAVVGPTASGKTSLAVKLAKELNGELISADSRQIYKGLDLGSGKEGEQDSDLVQRVLKDSSAEPQIKNQVRWIDGIPQWMIDICAPEERFTLFDFLRISKTIVADIEKRGKLPILVGGTGLYIKAFIEGYEHKKENNCQPMHDRDNLEKLELAELQGKSVKLGLKVNQDDFINKRRLIAAILRREAGFVSSKDKPLYDVLQIGIALDRERLYGNIDKRVDDRMDAGMLEEIESLLDGGVKSEWLLSLGLEYKYITQYVLDARSHPGKDKELFKEMCQVLKYKTHAFARRQLTWWRREGVKWARDFEEARREARKFL